MVFFTWEASNLVTSFVGKVWGKEHSHTLRYEIGRVNLGSTPLSSTIPFLGVHPKEIHKYVHTHTPLLKTVCSNQNEKRRIIKQNIIHLTMELWSCLKRMLQFSMDCCWMSMIYCRVKQSCRRICKVLCNLYWTACVCINICINTQMCIKNLNKKDVERYTAKFCHP